MRLRQIEIFYHVYQAGSISGAARDLNVSQPSVSKVLRHAEDQLGVELFLRSKGRLIPTQAAHELFEQAGDLYARLSIFNNALENLSKRRGGHLRMGVLPSLSLSVAPELIADLRATDPTMSFELTTLHTSEISDTLLSRQTDICIGFRNSGDPRITSRQIGSGRMVLVSSEPLKVSCSQTALQKVDGADFIGLRDSGPLADIMGQAFQEECITPNEIVTAHTYHVALSLVRKNVGMAVTDQFTAYSYLGAGLHRFVLDDLPEYPIFCSALCDHPDATVIDKCVISARSTLARIQQGILSLQPDRS